MSLTNRQLLCQMETGITLHTCSEHAFFLYSVVLIAEASFILGLVVPVGCSITTKPVARRIYEQSPRTCKEIVVYMI